MQWSGASDIAGPVVGPAVVRRWWTHCGEPTAGLLSHSVALPRPARCYGAGLQLRCLLSYVAPCRFSSFSAVAENPGGYRSIGVIAFILRSDRRSSHAPTAVRAKGRTPTHPMQEG